MKHNARVFIFHNIMRYIYKLKSSTFPTCGLMSILYHCWSHKALSYQRDVVGTTCDLLISIILNKNVRSLISIKCLTSCWKYPILTFVDLWWPLHLMPWIKETNKCFEWHAYVHVGSRYHIRSEGNFGQTWEDVLLMTYEELCIECLMCYPLW